MECPRDSTAIAGLAFARVGWALRARAHARGDRPPARQDDDGRALRAFATWWLAMGGSTLCVAGMALVGLTPEPSALLVAILRSLSLVLLSIALWGLLSHVLYLYTGRSRERAIGVVYTVLTVAVVAHIAWSRPRSVAITPWTVEVLGAREGLAISTALLVGAYLLPPIAAGIAYLRLIPRVEAATQKRRLRIVGVGIILWISTHLLARASDAALWQFVTRVMVGLADAGAVWSAYGARRPRPVSSDLEHRLRQLV